MHHESANLLWEHVYEYLYVSTMETGSLLVLKSCSCESSFYFIVEKIGCNSLTVARLDNPYLRLNIEDDQLIYKSGQPGRNNIFTIEPVDGTLYCKISIVRTQGKEMKTKAYLCIDNSPDKLCASHDSTTAATTFRAAFGPYESNGNINSATIAVEKTFAFQQWQIRRFFHEGYLQLARIVPSNKIETAVRYLNHHLGKPGEVVAGGVQTGESLGEFTSLV